ncbi:MAG TPA: transporter substrate-binding domain-containing protein, partial [Kiloniellales bacterium]|nr:transporter substrate-binding domain-containing protein [Kiloniellales bacterium]
MLRFAHLIEPPFCFRTPQGRVTGCDVELARLLAQRLDLGPFEPIETTFAELLPGLAEDRWDMTTGLFVTAERQRVALFSRPIWSLPDGLLVRRTDASGITGYRSLAARGLKLAVIAAQVQQDTARRLGVPSSTIRTFSNYEEAAAAVL